VAVLCTNQALGRTYLGGRTRLQGANVPTPTTTLVRSCRLSDRDSLVVSLRTVRKNEDYYFGRGGGLAAACAAPLFFTILWPYENIGGLVTDALHLGRL
jgi:hypothetical protein